MDKHLAIPLAAAFGNADHALISNNTVRRRRRGANNPMRARNNETRAIMGGPGRGRSRSRSRNRRPLHLPGLTSIINLPPTNAPLYNGPNYLSAHPSAPFRDPLRHYRNAENRREARNRARSPSVLRTNRRNRRYQRNISLGRNDPVKHAKIDTYMKYALNEIINHYADETIDSYKFVYNNTRSYLHSQRIRLADSTKYVRIEVPADWETYMERIHPDVRVYPGIYGRQNLNSSAGYSEDELRTAFQISH